MLTIVFLKKKFTKKLVFLRGLIEALGSKNYLSKYKHLEHLLGFNEDDGVHGRKPSASQGSNWKWNHPEVAY